MPEIPAEKPKKLNLKMNGKKLLAFSFILIGGFVILISAYVLTFSEDPEIPAEVLPPTGQTPPGVSFPISTQESISPSTDTVPDKQAESKKDEDFENPFLNAYLKELIKHAIEEIIKEEREKLRKELEGKKAESPVDFKPIIPLKIESSEKKKEKKNTAKKEPSLPSLITVHRVFEEKGTRILYTNLGILSEGSKINGWRVIYIGEGEIVFRKGKKKKTVRYVISFENGGKKDDESGTAIHSSSSF